MDYTTLTVPQTSLSTDAPFPLTSLYELFEQLPDPRRIKGKRYRLALVLTLLIVAKLCGEKTLKGASQWARYRGVMIAQHFGLKRSTMPCQSTYTNVLALVDPAQLHSLLSDFFVRWEAQSRCGQEPSRLQTPTGSREHVQLALDGKTVCSTTAEPHPLHHLSFYDVKTGTMLAQCNVGEKANEISAVKTLLDPTLLKGRIVSADAMHTQRSFCQTLHLAGGFYLLIAKDNQPTLREDLQDYFEDPTPDRSRWSRAKTVEKGHGRLETREIIASPDLRDWFAKRWCGIEQVFRVERTALICKSGECRHQIVYGITNLPLHQASAQRLLELARQHWAIENRLHWRRDVTLGEDACQSRTGRTPHLLALLNTCILSLMDRLGVKNVPDQIRWFQNTPEQAIHLVQTGTCHVV